MAKLVNVAVSEAVENCLLRVRVSLRAHPFKSLVDSLKSRVKNYMTPDYRLKTLDLKAQVAKLVDAPSWGGGIRKDVAVRIRSWAQPHFITCLLSYCYFTANVFDSELVVLVLNFSSILRWSKLTWLSSTLILRVVIFASVSCADLIDWTSALIPKYVVNTEVTILAVLRIVTMRFFMVIPFSCWCSKVVIVCWGFELLRAIKSTYRWVVNSEIKVLCFTVEVCGVSGQNGLYIKH